MKIEIWSDVMCPFCFIGKHRLDAALDKIPFKDELQIEWKSFQLNPTLEPKVGVNMYQQLSESKQLPIEQIMPMFEGVERMGKTADVEFHFDKAVPANTQNAHRLIHFAQHEGKGSEMKERLFQALFVEGENLNDLDVLTSLASEVGLNKGSVAKILQGNDYTDEVLADMQEAQQLGIQGVPFFVFNRKYAISGAQDESLFQEAVESCFKEWLQEHPSNDFKVIEGAVCRVDGTCD